MTQPIIRYPKAGGGHWLGNLVWHHQTRDWTIPEARVVFDLTPQGNIKLDHWFETYPDGTPKFYQFDYKQNKLFSTDCKFNMYLNFCTKLRYNFHHIERLSPIDQIFDLSNTAVFLMTNKHVDQYYCHNIDLDYAWIFQDPDQFINWIYVFMDNYNIPFTDNRAYAHASINYYKSTCANPADIVGNYESIIWLGWCHAVSTLKNITLKENIALQQDINSVIKILEPTYIQAKDLAEQNLFYWTHEYTTP